MLSDERGRPRENFDDEDWVVGGDGRIIGTRTLFQLLLDFHNKCVITNVPIKLRMDGDG